MSRRAAYPPGKVWADESTPYEDAKGCVLALPWGVCHLCGAPLLRTGRYRSKAHLCEAHGLECGGFQMTLVSTPIFARTSRVLHEWHAEVYQTMTQVHAHHERRVENLLLNCLQKAMDFVGPMPQNRKHRRWLRKRGQA